MSDPTTGREELLEFVITDSAHRDTAAMVLLYGPAEVSEEELLAIVFHVPFLSRNAGNRLLEMPPVPSEDALWRILENGPEADCLLEKTIEMLFRHYPSRDNWLKLLHPRWGVWDSRGADLLLESNPSRQELEVIVQTIAGFSHVPPWRELYRTATAMLSAG